VVEVEDDVSVVPPPDVPDVPDVPVDDDVPDVDDDDDEVVLLDEVVGQ